MPTEIAHTQNGSDASTQTTTTDGGHNRAVHPTDLTLFQLLELATVVEQSRYGLAVKRELEAYYDEKIHHGRLYPNLDRLVDLGLVEKYEIDKRTNGYEATERGERLHAAFVRYLAKKGGPRARAPERWTRSRVQEGRLMPATTLEAHATVDGILVFRDPTEDDAWLATSEPSEVRP